MSDLPRYQCFKIVEAAVIHGMRSVFVFADGGEFPEEQWRVELEVEPGRTEFRNVPLDTFKRGTPQPGDYLVKYTDQPDGAPYWSWSPKAAFEAGYTLLDNDIDKFLDCRPGEPTPRQ